jgi:hypothetical protein
MSPEQALNLIRQNTVLRPNLSMDEAAILVQAFNELAKYLESIQQKADK